MLEQKRKMLSLEQAMTSGQQPLELSPGAAQAKANNKIPLSLQQPVNKVLPDDRENQEKCLDLVKRLRLEKKARQRKLDEHQKKLDAKFQAEMEERKRVDEEKEVHK